MRSPTPLLASAALYAAGGPPTAQAACTCLSLASTRSASSSLPALTASYTASTSSGTRLAFAQMVPRAPASRYETSIESVPVSTEKSAAAPAARTASSSRGRVAEVPA